MAWYFVKHRGTPLPPPPPPSSSSSSSSVPRD